MSSSAKITRHKVGSEHFYSITVVVTNPDGKRKRVTFYADRPEDLEILAPPKKAPARKPQDA